MRLEYDAIQGLADYVSAFPTAALEGARIALNDVVEGQGLALYRGSVAEQADFPPGYLNDDRLGVGKRATKNDLAITVVGRFRPTSLARFVRTPNAKGKYGVRVRIKPRGGAALIKRAFLIQLKNGNQGLAVRLKPGETLRNTTGARELGKGSGVYLLYGPSVDQLLPQAGDRETPIVLEKVEQEFYRQFFRLAGKRR